MAGYEQEFLFTGGMNQDVEDRLLPPEDWRYALNCRSGNNEKDAVGSVENIQGNALVSIDLPAGENRCIKSQADERGSIFYFVYNDLGNHCILRYRIQSNTIETVLFPRNQFLLPVIDTKFLNFQNDPRYRIVDVDIIVMGNGQEVMYWTDGWVTINGNLPQISIPYDFTNLTPDLWELKKYNPPRKINVTLATNFTNDVFVQPLLPRYDITIGAQNYIVQNQFTDVIKYPPYNGPIVEFGSDTSPNTNYFRGRPLPQFRYRYQYIDGETSAWGPISLVALPTGDEIITGISAFNTYESNFVRIGYNTGHSTVVRIDIAVRFGNFGTWNLIETIDKFNPTEMNLYPSNRLLPDFTDLTFDFYNNTVLTAIATGELYIQSDVPLVAGTQEILQINRLSYAKIIEGYDSVIIDTETIVGFEPANIPPILFTNQALFVADGWYHLRADFTDNDPRQVLLIPRIYTNVYAGSLVVLTLKNTTTNDLRTLTFTIPESAVVDQTAWNTYVSDVIYEGIKQAFMDLSGSPLNPMLPIANVTAGGFEYFRIRAINSLLLVFQDIDVYGLIQKTPGFKLGAHHKLAVLYYDDGLRNVAADFVDVYIPFLTEDPSDAQGTPYDVDATHSGYAANIILQIKNLAPPQARTYKVGYGGSNILFFVQVPLVGNPTPQTNGNVRLNINALLKFFVVDNQPTPINYVWQEGDRVRFITDKDGIILTNYIDMPISSAPTMGSDFFIEIAPVELTTLNIGDTSLMEIYRLRPTTDQDQTVYEFSDQFDVLYNSASNVWVHQSGEGFPDQSPVNPSGIPAQILLERGDVYVKRRGYKDTDGTSFFWDSAVEDFNFSDFYPSEDIDRGRVNVVSRNAKQQVLNNNGRHSEPYFENTQINGLSTFLSAGGEMFSVPLAFGSITRIIEVGMTLKVVQENKVVSIYVGRLQTQLADGSSNLIASSEVWGSQLIPENENGSTWPLSVYSNGRHIYFVDSIRGEVIRDSNNGPFPISKYGMTKTIRNLFRTLSKWQSQMPSGIDVVSTYDENLGGYMFTILVLSPEITDIESQTIFFHEESNKWKTYLSYTPEMHGEKGPNGVVSFVNGELWKHYDETVPYNNFYGVQYRSKFQVVHNADANKVKVFDNVVVNSNKKWELTGPLGTEMNLRVPANDQYPSGMASLLPASKFFPREGQWVAVLLNDANSPNFATPIMAVVNGRRLRGYILDAIFEIDSEEYVRLFSVIFKSTPSELSK